MWQRKQTTLLAVVLICMVASLFFPVWKVSSSKIEVVLSPFRYTITVQGATSVIYFPYCVTAVLAVASATLAWIEIRRFRDRLSQIKIGALNSLCMAAVVGLSVYFATRLIEDVSAPGKYGMAVVFPAIAMLCNMVANRLIRRDEKTLRDADRIR